MTPNGVKRTIAVSLIAKIGLPLLLGLITIIAAEASSLSSGYVISLGALVILGFMLVLFLIDLEVRLLGLESRVETGFARINKSSELSGLLDKSVLGTQLLTAFLEAAGATDADASVSPLLQNLARREIQRVTWLVGKLPVGSEIAYDGEDRDWLLGLTGEAQHSIDAISLSTVDAGLRGFDGGLWTSDLGARYLEAQREAAARQVTIRRIFVFENANLARDETFMNITQRQRDVGVDVRMLDHQLIPDWLSSMIFDYIIFDGLVSYETTPATSLNAGGTRPAIVRTLLAPMPKRVHDLTDKFEQLWLSADPERQISG